MASSGMEYEEMYQKMYDAYHEAVNQTHALIADVGRRFYELAGKQDLYAGDDCHPNDWGSNHYSVINQEKLIKRNLRSLEKLGVDVIIQPKKRLSDFNIGKRINPPKGELIRDHGVSLNHGTILYSNQGCHYTSYRFIEILHNKNLCQSISRKGNCRDNVPPLDKDTIQK